MSGTRSIHFLTEPSNFQCEPVPSGQGFCMFYASFILLSIVYQWCLFSLIHKLVNTYNQSLFLSDMYNTSPHGEVKGPSLTLSALRRHPPLEWMISVFPSMGHVCILHFVIKHKKMILLPKPLLHICLSKTGFIKRFRCRNNGNTARQ